MSTNPHTKLGQGDYEQQLDGTEPAPMPGSVPASAFLVGCVVGACIALIVASMLPPRPSVWLGIVSAASVGALAAWLLKPGPLSNH